MCRMAGYVGPPVALSTLLFDADWSLYEQAYRPKYMRHGTINVDGTGLCWWAAGEPEPLRYVTTAPPWADVNLSALTPRLSSRLQLQAVRSATIGNPFSQNNVSPFVRDGVGFTHNGWIGGFRTGVGRTLSQRLPDHLYNALDAVSDSLLYFHTVLKHREQAPGDGLAGAIVAAAEEITSVVRASGERAVLNVLAATSDELVAFSAGADVAPNTLYVDDTGQRYRDAAVVASEPLDDDERWRPVPSGSPLRFAVSDDHQTPP